MGFDYVFQNYSPNSPAQVFMDPSFTAVSSPSAPSLLLGAAGVVTLWINVGQTGTLTVNGEVFGDNGWSLLAQINNYPLTFKADPLSDENFIFQTLADPTLSAVIAKLAIPAANGAQQKWNAGFWRMFVNS